MPFRAQWISTRDRIRSSLWFAPSAAVILAAVLLLGLIQLDARVEAGGVLAFDGSATDAREIASVIAAAILGFIGIVFSITILALQLASGQFSPRVLRTFLRDWVTQLTLGLYVATFMYSLALIKYFDGTPERVPALTFDAMFVLAFLCVGMFILYVDRISQSVRVVTILDAVAEETANTIARTWPAEEAPVAPEPGHQGGTATVITSGSQSGVVTGVDHQLLVKLATQHDIHIVMQPTLGDFVRHGGQLAEVMSTDGAVSASIVDEAASAWSLAGERTMQQDAAFGFRQIMDIAQRALSPGVNDPTTAVQAIDRVHTLLVIAAARADTKTQWLDGDGVLRLSGPGQTWVGLLTMVVSVMYHDGREQERVVRRLDEMLRDLHTVVSGDRAEAVRDWQAQVDAVLRPATVASAQTTAT